jgi:CTP:molybdopterin cytidylyltransferase MocA
MISAIVLAAGRSRRMKQSKMVLPWGNTTVIGKVIGTLIEAGVNDLHVVTGDNQKELENALPEYKIDFIFNPKFADGEMLTSIRLV